MNKKDDNLRKQVNINVRLDENTVTRLQYYAQAHGDMSLSAVLRLAIQVFLFDK